eukprot:scaffold12090_cov89-Isochrysis_galbana.AAC.3
MGPRHCHLPLGLAMRNAARARAHEHEALFTFMDDCGRCYDKKACRWGRALASRGLVCRDCGFAREAWAPRLTSVGGPVGNRLHSASVPALFLVHLPLGRRRQRRKKPPKLVVQRADVLLAPESGRPDLAECGERLRKREAIQGAQSVHEQEAGPVESVSAVHHCHRLVAARVPHRPNLGQHLRRAGGRRPVGEEARCAGLRRSIARGGAARSSCRDSLRAVPLRRGMGWVGSAAADAQDPGPLAAPAGCSHRSAARGLRWQPSSNALPAAGAPGRSNGACWSGR